MTLSWLDNDLHDCSCTGQRKWIWTGKSSDFVHNTKLCLEYLHLVQEDPMNIQPRPNDSQTTIGGCGMWRRFPLGRENGPRRLTRALRACKRDVHRPTRIRNQSQCCSGRLVLRPSEQKGSVRGDQPFPGPKWPSYIPFRQQHRVRTTFCTWITCDSSSHSFHCT